MLYNSIRWNWYFEAILIRFRNAFRLDPSFVIIILAKQNWTTSGNFGTLCGDNASLSRLFSSAWISLPCGERLRASRLWYRHIAFLTPTQHEGTLPPTLPPTLASSRIPFLTIRIYIMGFIRSVVWLLRTLTAQHQVGLKHFHGRGVPEDKRESMKWFKLAADQVSS